MNMTEKTRQEIGRKLKLAREKLNYSQAEAATKAEISINYYARIERGEENPSMEVLLGIIQTLKVKSSDILPF